MARANVPQFGNWDSDQSVPYTVYFEKARKNRGGGGKMINPNDPEENPELYSIMEPSPIRQAPEPVKRGGGGGGGIMSTPERRRNKEDMNDFKPPYADLPDLNKNSSRKTVNEPNYAGGRSQKPSRSTRTSMGSEQSFERSPLHPQYQATPGRSRLRPTARGDESPGNKGAALPKFGEWDDKNPQSAENYTHIFNKVREQRSAGPVPINSTPPRHPSYDARVPKPKKNSKSRCFPWW